MGICVVRTGGRISVRADAGTIEPRFDIAALPDTSTGALGIALSPGVSASRVLSPVQSKPIAHEPFAEIEPHLAEVRRAGYRQGPSAQLVGVIDMSVPVIGPDGDGVAALTCAYIEHPGDTVPDGRKTALAKLRTLAALLSFSALA